MHTNILMRADGQFSRTAGKEKADRSAPSGDKSIPKTACVKVLPLPERAGAYESPTLARTPADREHRM